VEKRGSTLLTWRNLAACSMGKEPSSLKGGEEKKTARKRKIGSRATRDDHEIHAKASRRVPKRQFRLAGGGTYPNCLRREEKRAVATSLD